MNYKINAIYFSATGTTEKLVKKLSYELSNKLKSEVNFLNFTLAEARKKSHFFDKNDFVIVGLPVYAGRVPNVLLSFVNSLKANGALAVAVVVYGNRNYDDALIELKDILETNQFKVIAAGAFIGEHSFSKTLAEGRPDDNDLTVASDFANQIYEKISALNYKNIEVKGNKPYRTYYKPKDAQGNYVDIRKVTPKTNENCTNCKLCASVCPMGSIDYDNVSQLNGICIKCGACIKKCPVNAKYYDDENYLNHKCELEIEYADRKEPELFI
jgi:ferredoxin/protein involved in ribonucleotide reduction